MDRKHSAVQSLVHIGFSEYEAKSYVTLLAHQPATPYEIAKQSGIPTSKIYDVFKKMEKKGYILPVDSQNDKKLYAALEPDDIAAKESHKVTSSFDDVSKAVAAEKNNHENNYIWPVQTNEDILAKCSQMIDEAKKEILISIWREESTKLLPALENAYKRGVHMAVIHYGEHSLKEIKPVFRHPIEDSIYEEKGGRSLHVVVDNEEALIATFWANGRIEGGWTRNRAFVTTAEDYIRHDIYTLKVEKQLGKKLTDLFGKDLSAIRNVFERE